MTDQTPVALLYGAKSTEDRRGSIDTQLADGRKLATDAGLDVVGTYHDEAASAYKGDRGAGLAQAMAHAERLAAEGRDVSLIVQHSDRLARGDAKRAKHLVEYALWGIKADVTIRSVQDPGTFEDLLRAVLTGERNREDSARKAQAVADGMARSRERGDAGWLARGILPDGYEIVRSFDDRGQVKRTARKDPARAWIWELVWAMARDGAGAPAIQLALADRGALTVPRRRDHRVRPFDVHRIDWALRNPVYAGLIRHRGQIVGAGDWPRYIEPEDWHAIQARRRARGGERRSASPKGGRPPVGYLLTGLATCGECGAMLHPITYRKHRKDGAQTRRYHCPAHHEYSVGDPNRCDARPYDAAEADRMVLAGIDQLLADADALRDQLGAGRRAERARLERDAAKAKADADRADRVIAKAMDRYEKALADDDDEAADIAMAAVRRVRREADAARSVADAALDALSTPVAVDDADVLARVWAVLSGRVADAGGDVAKLNAALRETFASFRIVRHRSGLRIVPTISADTLARTMRGDWDAAPPAFRPGQLTAVHLDSDGEQVAYDGAALTGPEPASWSKDAGMRPLELPAFTGVSE